MTGFQPDDCKMTSTATHTYSLQWGQIHFCKTRITENTFGISPLFPFPGWELPAGAPGWEITAPSPRLGNISRAAPDPG